MSVRTFKQIMEKTLHIIPNQEYRTSILYQQLVLIIPPLKKNCWKKENFMKMMSNKVKRRNCTKVSILVKEPLVRLQVSFLALFDEKSWW